MVIKKTQIDFKFGKTKTLNLKRQIDLISHILIKKNDEHYNINPLICVYNSLIVLIQFLIDIIFVGNIYLLFFS